MSLLTELKRRNVIRVAVAYVVAAWLLLQITDVLMSVLGLPEVVGKAVFLLLVIGFVPAVVFSWAYELTPEGLKRDAEVHPGASAAHHTARKLDAAVIVMLLAVGALVVWDRLVPEEPAAVTEESGSTGTATPATDSADTGPATEAGVDTTLPAPATDAMTSLAVLPFANMSPDPDNEYFADGISEELLNVLVDIEGLRVPSRTSSFAFKGQNRDIRDIAGQLQVNHVLEGSVRKAGNQVRITAQLIDVSTDTHLWSETYDRELADIFAVQDEIAGHIVSALGDVLQFSTRNDKPTENLEAYTLYLRGRHLFQQREESLIEAERLLREAVTLDPDFAEAWGTLATTCINLPAYLQVDRTESEACTREAAERALDLDPTLAEPRLALAQILGGQGRNSEALELYETVVRQHPNHALARLWYGVNLQGAGYLALALEQYEVAAGLEPSYGLMLDWLARGYVATGQLERGVETAARALELGRLPAGVPIAHGYLAEGRLEDVARYIDVSDELNWGQVPWLFRIREDPGQLDAALAWVDTVSSLIPQRLTDYHRFSIMITVGTPEQAFEQVRHVETFDDTVGWLLWSPAHRRLMGTEAMKAWARDRGFVALWRERGWPDLCRPVGDDDFECDG